MKVVRGFLIALCTIFGAVVGIFCTIGLTIVVRPDVTTEFALNAVRFGAAIGSVCGFIYWLNIAGLEKNLD